MAMVENKRRCQYCGESEPSKFYRSDKTGCRACRNLRAAERSAKRRLDPSYREKQAVYYREWYAKNGRNRAEDYVQIILLWQKNHRRECNVRRMVWQAVKDGKLERPLRCSCCGRKARISAHHDDYDKPFEILWVCSSCHKKIDLGVGA